MANDDRHFPGSLTGHGATCQQLRVQPEVIAQAEVSKPVARRADQKPRTRAESKKKDLTRTGGSTCGS
jgi:hypothetical protein